MDVNVDGEQDNTTTINGGAYGNAVDCVRSMRIRTSSYLIATP